MVDSARLGDPPLTSRDGLIQKALKTYRTNFNGNPKLPFGARRPIPPSPDLAGESNAWRTKTAAATFICLIVIVTVGRFFFWWRRRQNWGLGLDDALVTVAAAIALAYVGHILSAFVEGTCLGRHMWFCTYEDINRLYLTFTIGQTVFYFSVYCSKLSLLFFIKRITRAVRSRLFNTIHWIFLPFLICCGLISFFGTAFQCTPEWARWSLITLAKVDRKDYKCLDNLKFQIALRAMHITTDCLLWIYPALILKQLQMSLQKKIGIAFVFSFGLLCVLCSVVRNIIFGKKRPDYTYMAHDVYIWNMLDITSACIVPSLPAFYPLFNSVYKKVASFFSTRLSSGGPTPNKSSASTSRHVPTIGSDSNRHNPRSPTLQTVSGPYTRSDDKSTASGDVGLVSAAETPSGAMPGYVQRAPVTLNRQRGKTKELEAEAIELGERNV